MDLRRTAAGMFAIVIAAGIVACNSDRAYAPPDTILTDQQVSRDVAVSEGDAAASDLVSLGNSANMAAASLSAAECAYGSGRWTCAPVMENNLTIVRSYAFFDAAGQPMKVRDDLTTSSVNFQLSVNGTVARDTTFSGVVHRTRNMTVSGLLGNETTRRWDGFGASADTNTHRSALTTRTYAGRSVDSLKAVVFAQPRTPSSYPLSGTMVRSVAYLVTSVGRGNERRSVDRRVVITYNGTENVQLQSGSVTCTLHLDTHKVDNCSG
jgi:hypothetical protein